MLRRVLATHSAYVRIKESLLAGELPTGRLDLTRLADKLRVSQTPVREALARLAAEDLINFTPHIGYSAATLSEADLRDLYAWNFILVDAALAFMANPIELGHTSEHQPTFSDPHHNNPTHIGYLCADIGARAANSRLHRQILHINDHLTRVRACEAGVFCDVTPEFEELVSSWRAQTYELLRRLMTAYHRRRIASARALVAAMFPVM